MSDSQHRPDAGGRVGNTLPRRRWILLGLLLLAFALRVYRLDAQSLWYDEAVTAQVVQQGLAELARWTADDIQPPLYYALVAGWQGLAGSSEWALRLPSAALGLLMVALVYVMARRLFGRVAGLLAGLLAAVYPLWVYYSQEARMYSMLTALGLLAGYALLRVLAPQPSRPHASRLTPHAPRHRWWILFAASSIALLYTHYFAAFLLLAVALYFLLVVVARQSRGRQQILAEGVITALAVILAYLPWLPNALRRFQIDASYWSGTLKLNEALRHLAISFTTGETVLEAQARPLAWAMAALAGGCLLALLWPAMPGNAGRRVPAGGHDVAERSEEEAMSGWPVLFIVLYLLVPIIAILTLSYRTPKFNPRYLMLASPGLILLLAGALALPLVRRRPQRPGNALPRSRRSPDRRGPLGRRPRSNPGNAFLRSRRSPDRRGVFSALALALLAAILTVFLIADRNWFVDPAFTKDDWRGAVAYVRSHLAADEGVVLVSGHAYPAWHYYAADIEPVRLPQIEILDVNAVLNLNAVAEKLRAGLAGRRGAWLVQWQEEVVDPTGVVPFLLAAAGQEQPVGASFWGLGAPQHFRFHETIAPDSATFAAAARPDQALSVNFANQVELVGFSQPACDQPMCPIYLFWRALAPLTADYKLTATLQESGVAASQPLDRRLAAYNYPTFRWQPGQLVLGRLDIAPDLGTPPGDNYRLRLGVYDGATAQPLAVLDEAGNPQGTWTWLQPLTVNRLITAGPGGPNGDSTPVAAAPEIELVEVTLDRDALQIGEAIHVTAWWQATAPVTRPYVIAWQWLESDGVPLASGSESLPVNRWPVGALVRGRFRVKTPVEELHQVPGPRRLRIGIVESEPAGSGRWAGETVELTVELLPFRPLFEAPPTEYPVTLPFGQVIQLVGVDGASRTAERGAIVPVTVTWQALRTDLPAYTGFVHLLDSGGRPVAQDDHVPRRGERPTTAWLAGEVIQDRYELSLPADLPAGTYRLEIGLYDADAPGLPRLPTADGSDSVILGQIVVN